jgi:hypothetical protein
MNAGRDVERLIADWFIEEAVLSAPDRVLEGTGRVIDRTNQRRPGAAWRTIRMSPLLRLGAAAVFGAVLFGGGMLLLQRPSQPSVGVEPSASPSSSPSAQPSQEATASDLAAARVPGEFTACVPSNSELRHGTDETIQVPNPDGDMTLERRRGFTWSGAINATDDRFSGTHYYSWDGDGYTLASGEPGPQVVAEGHRIENDEGAWQGWSMGAGMSEDTRTFSPIFLTGEGAYEGLTAILFSDEGACFFNFRGVVIEVPEPPVPYTAGE